MRGNGVMRSLRWFAAGALLGVLSSAASAFQESKGGVIPSGTPSQGVTTLDIGADGKALPAPAAAGPEIRIPGLGKLGVLPKLDFGLELLYGVGDQGAVAPVAPSDRPNDQPDGVQIRGSLKHKF